MAGGVLAGSVLTLDRALANFIEITGTPLEQALRLLTVNPATMTGLVDQAGSLAVGGVEQGMKLNNPGIAFMDATNAMLPFLRTSTVGLLLILLGNLLFALIFFAMTFVWGKSLLKKAHAIVTAPLKNQEVKA